MTMKRSREDEQVQVESLAMANCLMLLSKLEKSETFPSERIFECKTCNRQFTSFQALGGHRASHKKPKLMAGDLLQQVPTKPKTHECSICGVEFALGQALGGHMRRHRAELEANSNSKDGGSDTTTVSTDHETVAKTVPVLKRSDSSCKRAWGLDLHLRPYDGYLKLGW